MAHHAKHRRDLAAAELQSRAQPTVRKHPKQALIAAAAAAAAARAVVEDHPDPTVPSRPLDVPRIAVSQKPAANASYAACKDKFLQAMALNKSADFEATKFSSCSGAARQGKGNQEVGRRGRKTKGDCAAKVKKSAGEGGAVEKEGSKVKASRDGIDAVKFASLSLEEKELRKGHEEGVDSGRRNSTSSLVAASGRRRRSFGGVEVELSDVFASSGVRVVAVDMPPFMQIHAVECARKASDSLEKFSCRALACTLKKEFDGVYGPAWHCIVGTSFGSFVTHSVGGFMYFSMDQKMYVLLFKTTVQRAD